MAITVLLWLVDNMTTYGELRDHNNDEEKMRTDHLTIHITHFVPPNITATELLHLTTLLYKEPDIATTTAGPS
jgi:hypothetical protein